MSDVGLRDIELVYYCPHGYVETQNKEEGNWMLADLIIIAWTAKLGRVFLHLVRLVGSYELVRSEF